MPGVLGSVTSFGGALFLVVVYAIFLMAERDTFARKSRRVPEGDRADQASHMLVDINAGSATTLR